MMIEAKRQNDLVSYSDVYHTSGYTLSRALELLQIIDPEEVSLFTSLWGEPSIDRINELLGRTGE